MVRNMLQPTGACIDGCGFSLGGLPVLLRAYCFVARLQAHAAVCATGSGAVLVHNGSLCDRRDSFGLDGHVAQGRIA